MLWNPLKIEGIAHEPVGLTTNPENRGSWVLSLGSWVYFQGRTVAHQDCACEEG
jgi:hypothetical protein